MSNHNHRSIEAPSRVSIIATWLVSAAAIMATFYVAGAQPADGHHLAGVGLGVLASIMLIGQAMGRAYRRSEIHHNTGFWLNPRGSESLTVRLDDWPPGTLPDLAQTLIGLEADGWRPSPDPRTAKIRRRLGLD